MAWVGLYHFDDLGSPTVVDVSGNGYHIDLSTADAEQVAGGLSAGALGKTGPVMPTVPPALLAASETDDRTIMFDALTSQTVWWIRWESDTLASGTWGFLILSSGGPMQVQARRQSDGALATRPSATGPEAAVWHNYAATYERATGVISLYRDGVLASTSSFAAGTQLAVGANRINIAEWSGTGPRIDNLRIGTHAASPAEIAALAGTPVVAPTPPVELSATLPIVVGLSGVVDPPPAAVAGLSAAIPVTVGLSAAVAVPPATVPTLSAALPVAVGLSGTVVRPPATVRALSATVPLRLTHAPAVLDDGIKRNTTLHASIGGPKWTATLGGTMADRTINRLSREHVPVDVTDNGAPVTGWRYVILPETVPPTDVAQFAGTPTELGGKLGVLVGPGTAHVLEPGEHVVWVRYEADPEAPVVEAAGRITITRGATP